jgi:hypothetical protein
VRHIEQRLDTISKYCEPTSWYSAGTAASQIPGIPPEARMSLHTYVIVIKPPPIFCIELGLDFLKMTARFLPNLRP